MTPYIETSRTERHNSNCLGFYKNTATSSDLSDKINLLCHCNLRYFVFERNSKTLVHALLFELLLLFSAQQGHDIFCIYSSWFQL